MATAPDNNPRRAPPLYTALTPPSPRRPKTIGGPRDRLHLLAYPRFARLAVPYFRSEDRWAGRLLLAAVITAELSLVGIAVLLNAMVQ